VQEQIQEEVMNAISIRLGTYLSFSGAFILPP